MNAAILAALACVISTSAIAQADDFDAKVAPILARRCLDCHSGPDPKGKLDLARRESAFKGGEGGEAIVAGKPEESPLWEMIDSGEMPPKSPLSRAEKGAIRDWIASGAGWGTDPIDPYQATTSRRAGRDWWSLQPLKKSGIPGTSRARSPIDAFLVEKLEAEGLSLAPEADRTTLIRRLSFDLTGLPPSPEDVDSFDKDDSPEAYAKLVDRLLDSPQYGVRWARWWLDLARYGESNGYEYDEFRPNAWRYRDWVVEALNRDMPYDEFARLQVAGDAIRPDDPGAAEATGFLVAGAYDTAGQNQQSPAMKAVVRADEMEDIVGTVGQAFLGLTVHCARCHDHKFDPIRQQEYYRIASALGGVRHGERDLSALDPEAIKARNRVEALSAEVEAIEAPARARILAERPTAAIKAPEPLASWDFDRGPEDRRGALKVTLQGGASLTPEGLRLDGKGAFAATPPLLKPLNARTIEAWVKLDNLDQRGGGVVSVQALDGSAFDAIVFAENEPNRWVPGSEGFKRSRSVSGPAEVDAARWPVHVAITYAQDGTIRIFRDGRPYGESYKVDGCRTFPAGETQVVFGLRHAPVGGNKMLAGTIVRARLYDRALAPSEILASFGEGVSQAEIVAALSEADRENRAGLLKQIDGLRATMAGRPRKAYCVSPREAGATQVQIRGNPQQPGDVVSAGGVAAVAGPIADFGLAADAPEKERRERLAGWITDPKNPLFARVIVNRLWQAHFGGGLVESSSDLGFNGGRPSHPELLDWLAAEMVERGWSLKALHRLIVNTEAYRQSSRSVPAAKEKDAGGRLLWRKAPKRLEAEMVRDAMLAVSGTLDVRLGGPSFRDLEVYKVPGTPAVLYKAVDPGASGLNRRTLYRAWARGGRSALLDAFDCPDPSTTAPRRAVTTTPLQALAMMNNALVLHLSDAFAARLVREAGADPGNQVDRAYRLAFGRDPDAEERAGAVGVVEKFGATTLARAIFNSNEFLYVD